MRLLVILLFKSLVIGLKVTAACFLVAGKETESIMKYILKEMK